MPAMVGNYATRWVIFFGLLVFWGIAEAAECIHVKNKFFESICGFFVKRGTDPIKDTKIIKIIKESNDSTSNLSARIAFACFGLLDGVYVSTNEYLSSKPTKVLQGKASRLFKPVLATPRLNLP